MLSLLRLPCLGVALCAVLTACNGSVVREHYFPSPTADSNGAPTTTRVRMVASGPPWALDCLAQKHALSDVAHSMSLQQSGKVLAMREAHVATQTVAAQSVATELQGILLAQAAGGLREADRLRALNAVCAGLGATQSYATVSEARAFLDLAAAKQAQP